MKNVPEGLQVSNIYSNWFRNVEEKVPCCKTEASNIASCPCLFKYSGLYLYHAWFLFHYTCMWKLFLKEEVYQLLESKRDRVRHVAALTLQRYTRMYFVRKRYTAFRMKIIRLQAHCRGFLARCVEESLLPIMPNYMA